MTTSTLPLTDFLVARIAEDEQRARFGRPFDFPENHEDDYSRDWYEIHADAWHTARCGRRVGEGLDRECVCGVPARVLAECEAKRQIIDLRVEIDSLARDLAFSEPDEANAMRACRSTADAFLALLALPYANHPDYRHEWRP